MYECRICIRGNVLGVWGPRHCKWKIGQRTVYTIWQRNWKMAVKQTRISNLQTFTVTDPFKCYIKMALLSIQQRGDAGSERGSETKGHLWGAHHDDIHTTRQRALWCICFYLLVSTNSPSQQIPALMRDASVQLASFPPPAATC